MRLRSVQNKSFFPLRMLCVKFLNSLFTLLSGGYVSNKGDSKNPVEDLYSTYKRELYIVLFILLLVIPLILAFQFRTTTVDLDVTDIWARDSVYNAIRNQIGQEVDRQYPYLPTENRQQRVNEAFEQELAANREVIESQIEQSSAYFTTRMQDDSGQTYLLAIDPYQHLRLTENIVSHGHPGDYKLDDGTMWNDHKFAPLGVSVGWDFQTWFMANLYKFVKVFNSDVTVLGVVFYFPVIFSLLCIFPAFFIGKRKAGLLGAFFAATLVAVHSGFVGRTPAGFSDSDVFVILFPLVAAWAFLEAFEVKENEWKRRAIWLGITGLIFGLFSFAWSYWWFFFDVFVLIIIAHIIYVFLNEYVETRSMIKSLKSQKIRWSVVMLIGFFFSTGVFVSLFQGITTFLTVPFSAFAKTAAIKAAVNTGNLWPNVLTTVAELNPSSIPSIVGNIGGKFIFVLALMGIIATLLPKDRLKIKDWSLLGFSLAIFLYLVGPGTSLSIIQFLIVLAVPIVIGALLQLKDERQIDIKYAIFLTAWLAASIFTMTKGVRFVLLLIPPFAIAAGIAVGFAFFHLKQYLVEEAKFSVLWVAPLLFILFSLLLIQPIQAGYNTGMHEAPSMNDAWWDSLSKIKEESAPDAIINSWWDFGHWFKYVGDRAVTFDGASQNTPMAHWIGRVLITDDEKEALAILRMLDCGSYRGVEEVMEGIPEDDHYTAISLTKEIIMLAPEKAEERLRAEGVSDEQISVILDYTHCEPPENYFITSGDMVGKGGVWGHFGSWNFERADAYQNLRKLPQATAVEVMSEKYGWTEEQASQTYYTMQTLTSQEAVNTWISPWPGYQMSNWRGCTVDSEVENLSVCNMGLVINNQNGVQTVLDAMVINETNTSNSFLIFGSYNSQGQRVGVSTDIKPASIIFATNTSMSGVVNEGADFGMSFMVDMRGENPRVLMTDPLNINSMFTRLFFMNGWNTKAFEKFSDQTTFTGVRIIVWKVDWEQLEEFDLV
jgi:asparagine N-glycosylation enzyme membrane subunit Stt3